MTAGGFTARLSGAGSVPRTSVSTSLTILMTCWSGRTAFRTSVPTACSRTLLMKVFTTGSATSASRSARRTSRSAVSTSDSRSAPRFPSAPKTSCSLSFRLSNMNPALPLPSTPDPGAIPKSPSRIAASACGIRARKLQGRMEPARVWQPEMA